MLDGRVYRVRLDYDKEVSFCINDTNMIELVRTDPSQDIIIKWDPNDIIISSLDSFKITVTSMDTGMYFLPFYAINQFGCELYDTIKVTFVFPPEPDFTYDYECGDLEVRFMCDVTNVTYLWDFGDGKGTSREQNPVYTYDTTGYYDVTLTLDNGVCTRSITKTLLVVFIDEDIDRNPIICFGPGMVFLNPGGSDLYEYKWSPGIYLDDSTAINPKAMVDSTTIFTVVITDPNFPDCPKEFEVKVSVGEDLMTLNMPEDTLICSFDDFSFTLETFPDDLSVTWCDSAGNVIGMGHGVVFAPDEHGFIVAKITDTLGCERRDTMNITAYDIDVNIDAPDSICNGDSAKINLIINDGGPVTIDWLSNDRIIGPDTGTVICVNPDETTTYVAKINNGLGCEWERNVTIYVGGIEDLPLIVTAEPDTINPGDSTRLNVDIFGNYDFMWTGVNVIDPNTQSPWANPSDPGTYVYEVKVTAPDGCMARGTVTVIVRDPDCIDGIFIPSAFSPNGDGENDKLYVRSNYIQTMELHIYDRWGKEVFMTNDQSIPWDGFYDGEELPPDVYGYYLTYLCVDGESYFKKGNVTILK